MNLETKENILVIDSDSAARTILHSCLADAGYRVVEAEAGLEAINLLAGVGVNLVLLSSKLPDMRGVEVLEELRKTYSCHELPVIMVLDSADKTELADCFQIGANDYIVKTVDYPACVPRVECQLNLLRMQQMIENQRVALTASARQASLGQMAGGIVHEIKTPLTVIKGMADLMSGKIHDGSLDLSHVHQCTERISQNVTRVDSIIRSIQAYSHQNSDHEPFEPISLSKVVNDTLNLCLSRLKASNIAWSINEFSEDLILECRAVEVSEVLVNLIANAADAVGSVSGSKIALEVLDLGDRIQMAVSNSGDPIPLEYQPRLFTSFFTSKPKGQGTGLGLSISAAIVSHHRGRIYLDPDSEMTRFVVELPKIQSGNPETEKVLVIDDDPDVRAYIRLELEKNGYIIEEAENGLDGWNIVNSQDISIVLTDYKMPQLNGVQLAERIGSIAGNKPKVIMITGFLNELTQYSDRGYWQDIFEKPVNWGELHRSIRRFSKESDRLPAR